MIIRNKPIADPSVRPPTLSERLTEVVRELRNEIQPLTMRTVTALLAKIEDYAHLQEASVRQDIMRGVEFHVLVWLDTLLSGTPLSPATLERVAVMGRRRVHQAISLTGLLRAFRLGSRELWSAMLEAVQDDAALMQELLFGVSPYFLYHFDVVAQAIGDAYQAELQLRMRWRDRLRYELCTIIFSNREDAHGFKDIAQALGINLSAEHAAIALRLSGPVNQTTEFDETLDPFFLTIARVLGAARDCLLYTVRIGDVLVWVPLPGGGATLANERGLVMRANALCGAGLKIAGVGVGLAARRHQDWRRSAEQALRALDLGPRLNPELRVHRYSESILDNAVLASEDTLSFLESIIRELSSEAGLLETLTAYLDLAMHRKATAGRLEIHTNTLDHRLNRIETILGAPLSDISVLAKLNAALRLHRLSIAGPMP